eukprot:756736-Hanusia_phi.AAC.2
MKQQWGQEGSERGAGTGAGAGAGAEGYRMCMSSTGSVARWRAGRQQTHEFEGIEPLGQVTAKHQHLVR